MIARMRSRPVSSLAMVAVLMLPPGGKVSLTLSGAKSGTFTMTEAGFCNTSVTFGKMTIHAFGFGSNNAQWAVTIATSTGMPKVGTNVISSAVTATLIDKTSGKEPKDQQRYEARDGTVTFTRSDAGGVAGTFAFNAVASQPARDGKVVSAKGTFEGAEAAQCANAAKGRP